MIQAFRISKESFNYIDGSLKDNKEIIDEFEKNN
jgi:hypothetical protein